MHTTDAYLVEKHYKHMHARSADAVRLCG
jgi:hypothetical protein